MGRTKAIHRVGLNSPSIFYLLLLLWVKTELSCKSLNIYNPDVPASCSFSTNKTFEGQTLASRQKPLVIVGFLFDPIITAAPTRYTCGLICIILSQSHQTLSQNAMSIRCELKQVPRLHAKKATNSWVKLNLQVFLSVFTGRHIF